MSKENNNIGTSERVSILESIRRRTGLLVGIVGLALLIFILESLLGSGASIFGNDDLIVGRINGKKVDRIEFSNRLEGIINQYRARQQGAEVSEQMRGQVITQVWNQYVMEYAIKPQFEKIGINVGDDELYELVVINPAQSIIKNLSDQNGRVNEQFAKPDGTLDLVKWRQAVQSVTGESEMAVKQMEDEVRETRRFEKFRALVNKGLYVTSHEAKIFGSAQRSIRSVSFVAKRFDEIADSTVKLTDADIEKYYSSHAYEYRNDEDARKVEFVTFNLLASNEDVADIEKDAQRVADELKGKSSSEDSVILAQESDNGQLSIRPMTKKNMVIRDSAIYNATAGTVFGPYNEGAFVKVYKLEAINNLADSAKVRHILIGINDPQTNQAKRSKSQAKREADSLLTLIKEKKAVFDTLVKTVSDDFGSKDKGGDYGWFNEETSFVEPFKMAGLKGVKGNISVVETDFGYHIIEVMDVSKTSHPSYIVAEVFKKIQPSEETSNKIYQRASEFAGKNNTTELFDKAVAAEKLTKRLADNIHEGDRDISGIDGAKEIVRWAFNSEKGSVSVFTFSDKYIVAKLAGVRNKGILPLEEVREEVTTSAMKAKKAELLVAQFSAKLNGVSNINDAATKTGLQVMHQANITLMQSVVDGVGMDNIFVGTAIGLKKGEVSKLLVGENCVFMIVVEDVQEGKIENLKDIQKQLEGEVNGRTDFEVFNAMKALSDIEDHRSKID
jgi:peptidyl-prolyl cis-trans isomerase D